MHSFVGFIELLLRREISESICGARIGLKFGFSQKGKRCLGEKEKQKAAPPSVPVVCEPLLQGGRLENRTRSAEVRGEEEGAEGKIGGAEDQVRRIHAFLEHEDDDRNGVD